MSFEMKIPVGTGPGNLQVHPCPALKMNRFRKIFGSCRKANRKLTQLRGLAEERKYLVRVTGMSPYRYITQLKLRTSLLLCNAEMRDTHIDVFSTTSNALDQP